jgi:uncharacterized membrane protein YdjX (TVP38/TMEM64 family)
MAASMLFVAAILAVLVYFEVHEQVVDLLEWVEEQGAWASVLFVLVMALVVVLLLPGALLTMGAGFVFGLGAGTSYVVVGNTLGATLAFLIARYLFGDRASRFVVSHPRLRLLSEELTHDDWKIVLLTRLIPFFPSKLANYFFGLTQFRLFGYIGASFIGFIPFSLHNVYLGSIVADLSQLGVRELERSLLEWTIYGAGFVATVIAIVYFNRLARNALASYTESDSTAEEVSREDPK